MKIGVFGDSYARTFDNYPDSPSLGKAWWEIIADKHELVNHGLAGSAAYYSIEKFREFHADYDKIIFFMTFPGRVYIGENNKITTPGYPRVISSNFNNYDSTKSALDLLTSIRDRSPIDEKKIRAVMDYFLYVLNMEEDAFKLSLYSEYVKKIRPDALLIDAHDVARISLNELVHWKQQDTDLFSRFVELRKCHFSEENNVIFSSLIEDWINTGTFTLDVNKFVAPTDSWQRYFKNYIV